MLRQPADRYTVNYGGTKLKFEHIGSLGEGTFGKVHLLSCVSKPDIRIAAKEIDVSRLNAQQQKNLNREVVILKNLNHPNIIRFVADSENGRNFVIFMEYAEGGELFDRIAPDVGIDEDLAHLYFVQLVYAVEYIHSKGICHRDLKPENILLDSQGNLKLTDFGLANVFKVNGQARLIQSPCGTPPYVAPEIYRPYQGDAVDIWSCGVILYVLLCGNTPWDEPTVRTPEYRAFVNNPALDFYPWNQFPPLVLSLLRGIMTIDPAKRITIAQIMEHPWFNRPNPLIYKGAVANSDLVARKLLGSSDGADSDSDFTPPIAYSQPDALPAHILQDLAMMAGDMRAIGSFSQPMVDIRGSSMSASPTTQSQTSSQAQAKITAQLLTRFFSTISEDELRTLICHNLEQFLVTYKANPTKPTKIVFHTIDKRKCPLKGEIRIQDMQRTAQRLVVFKKTKGDPIEFKRFFKALHEAITDRKARRGADEDGDLSMEG
ncbi:Pkinase-domain-containing protein [Gonapodya prolifera JEL478]|uniref:Pkinase-domain-containing protein n=1 Tax=Gonapodya prolifera (strain JEL478) TaxID=1344416 RepID=A0A139A1F8_GONPJ|nr:Pkinase-domain-containing protein [Gonapodya prolifera JEL478]|eukprot:KXS10458.1 Pkinase-domain-containing protein [Gonapodya prolifera JEL478]